MIERSFYLLIIIYVKKASEKGKTDVILQHARYSSLLTLSTDPRLNWNVIISNLIAHVDSY